MIMREQQAGSILPEKPEATDTVRQPSDPEGAEKAEAFLRDVAPHLGRLFGMDLTIRVGNGWATDLESGEVYADPKFFIERGYTPDMSVYATLHEVAAHLRELVTKPTLSEEVKEFVKEGEAQSIFHNIFSDIAGNKLIHAVLPKSMPKVAEEMYAEKLFKADDYSTHPRHLQFLYKIIRQEMIPDSETGVVPEVDEVIADLRDYKGKGDLIKYSTAVAKSRRVKMPAEEKFRIWTDMIYPIYDQLIQQDIDDPIHDPQSPQDTAESEEQDQGQGQESSETDPSNGEGDTQDQSDGDSNDSNESKEDSQASSSSFEPYYDDYHQNKHPEPLDEEQEGEIQEYGKDQERSATQPRNDKTPDYEQILDAEIRQETGIYTLEDQRRYSAEITKWLPQITEMREIYKQVIERRLAQRKGLSRKTFPEGAILDPNRLAQTVAEIRSGNDNPDAFRDYESRGRYAETIGNTDYVFLFDVSGSMQRDGKAVSAGNAAVIAMEGLAAMQRDIEEVEELHHTQLDLEIRTAIYTFGEHATLLKPLSKSLSLKERLDGYAKITNPTEYDTRDYLALREVSALKIDGDRRKIVMVITDGESGSPGEAMRVIAELRANGWLVYGIGIGSDAAANLYKPTARRVDDPALLPETIKTFIEDTIDI
jgi:hypothetical protein